MSEALDIFLASELPELTPYCQQPSMDSQHNEDCPIGSVLWPVIRTSPAMQAKCRFQSQLPE